MPAVHSVEQGEHISRIARSHGFGQWSRLWNDAGNEPVQADRPNPHVLYPGDEIVIPEHTDGWQDCATSLRHRFRARVERLYLRMVILDAGFRPIEDTAAELNVDAAPVQLSTNAVGAIEQEISAMAEDGRLMIDRMEVPLRVGHLDPVEEVSGYIARLNNLGYDAGEVNGTDPTQLQSAIEEFQCDNRLMVDGVCGPKTQAKLLDVHGC